MSWYALLLIQTFPADQRYVALFAEGNSDPVAPSADAPDRAHRNAAEFLSSVRKAVKKGELSAEPEVELEEREAQSRALMAGKKKSAEIKAVKRKRVEEE